MKTAVWNGNKPLGNIIDENELVKGDTIKYKGLPYAPMFIEKDIFNEEDTGGRIWEGVDYYLDDMEEDEEYTEFELKIVAEKIFSYSDGEDQSCLVGLFYINGVQMDSDIYAILPVLY